MVPDAFAMTRSIKEARKQAVLRALMTNRDRPVTASELIGAARVCGMTQESKRRRIRDLIGWLREEDGQRICADDHPTEGGYWLAKDAGEWQAYQAARTKRRRFGFVRDRRIREAVTDRLGGQTKLFTR